MVITKEEADSIKEHLLKQLDNFPEDKREEISKQINSMTTGQVEKFIEQNKLTHLGGQCIFCSIIANKSPSYKIDEDANNLAILEINPETKGHTLILPKEHSEKLPESAKTFAQIIAKKLQEKLKPQTIEINELKIMNHSLIEIVPLYGEEKKKRQASEEELKSLQEEINKKPKAKIEKPKTSEEGEEIPILKPRIP
jgi:histidine triad (HIT) family protein